MTRARNGIVVVVALFALTACVGFIPAVMDEFPKTKVGWRGNATLELVTAAIQKAGDRTKWQTEVV